MLDWFSALERVFLGAELPDLCNWAGTAYTQVHQWGAPFETESEIVHWDPILCNCVEGPIRFSSGCPLCALVFATEG